jgi:hypothetical protein
MIVAWSGCQRNQLIVSSESNVKCRFWNVVFCGRMRLFTFAIPRRKAENRLWNARQIAEQHFRSSRFTISADFSPLLFSYPPA